MILCARLMLGVIFADSLEAPPPGVPGVHFCGGGGKLGGPVLPCHLAGGHQVTGSQGDH